MDNNMKSFGAEDFDLTVEMTGLDGEVVTDEKLALAKRSVTKRDETENTLYFVMMTRGALYDPYDRNRLISRGEMNRLKFRKVGKDAYELYVRYLESKNRMHYSKAKRLTRG